jgi:hypothetical protein
MQDVRALIFALWIAAGKTLSVTTASLECLASGQLEIFNRGGKTMISSSVGSESFSFQLSGVLSADVIQTMAYAGWRAVSRFTTNAELEAWLKADDVQSMRVGFDTVRDI